MIRLVTTLVKKPGCNAEKVRQPGYRRAVINLYKPPTREVLLNVLLSFLSPTQVPDFIPCEPSTSI